MKTTRAMPTCSERKRVPILMYHSISYDATRGFKPFSVSPALFADQMAYLHEQAYTPLTVTQLVTMRTRKEAVFPEKPVVITFDDGFADFYSEALPVLQRYKFPATLYVTTAFVGSTSLWLKREGETKRPMLTWQHLREINAQGIECGGHSHTHARLDALPLPVARDEIVRSKELLECHLGQPITTFAYPFGYETIAVRNMVREEGYTSACTVGYAVSSSGNDLFALTRLMVGTGIDQPTFAALLSGQGWVRVKTVYMRCRSSAWRLARHSSAAIKRSMRKNSEV